MTRKVLENKTKRFKNQIGSLKPVYVTWLIEGVEANAVFRREKPKHCLTPTEFNMSFDYRDPVSYDTGKKRGENSFVFGAGGSYRSFDSGNGNNSLLKARAKSAGSEFNFGETLVEFGETVGLLNSTLNKLLRAMTAVKDGKFGKALSIMGDSSRSQKALKNLPVSKRISQGYLELSFGWLPMISDVHNATVAYTKGLLSAGDRIAKHSGSSRIDNFQGGIDPLWIPEARASVSGVVRSNAVIGANLNALGLANPLLMAWNKLPFSFLLDWFVPVSTVLGALTASAGLECYSQTVTTVHGTDSFNKSGGLYLRQLDSKRKIVSGLPLLSFERGPAFSLGQAITSLALLRSLN